MDSSAAPAGQGAHDPSQGGQDPGQSGQASGQGGQAGVQTGAEQTASGGARSGKVYERAAEAGSPGGVAYVRLSEVPAEGTDVMNWIVLAWAVAAASAVCAAALAGYLISRRIARPVVALAEASERMAAGDLSTRAEVGGRGEIGRLAGSFNLMAGQVETTVTELQRFVSDAAHELGTPLTALRADLELAQDAAVSDDERRLVTRALTQEQRLEDLGDGLLQLSRLQTPGGASRRQAVPPAFTLREAHHSDGRADTSAVSGARRPRTCRRREVPARLFPALRGVAEASVRRAE